MKKSYIPPTLVLVAFAILGGMALWAQAQPEAGEMPEHCRQMMERQQQMQQRMQQMDQDLEALVERMEAAEGEQKIDATAAVVAELVEQRRAMHRGMMDMCSGMMGHMMEGHMGGMKEGGAGAMACPMMKGMMGGMHGMKHGEQPPGQDDGGSR